MPSTFTWLAYSDSERDRTLEAIRLLDEPWTVDQIGIGGIRDGFAELLFPGTTTLQTRARYFLFIPWIYLELERRSPVDDVAGRGRWAEARLIETLLDSDEPTGVIGAQARERLRQLPSAVYWRGLHSWGIRLAETPRAQYHRRLERFALANLERDEDGGPVPGAAPPTWHPELPAPPEGFPTGATFALRRPEAEYLRDRIMMRHPESLIAHLVGAGRPITKSDFPWELDPATNAEMPAGLRSTLDHARAFSEAIHGASLLYNLMLAELSLSRVPEADGESKASQWVEDYTHQLEGWAALIEARHAELAAWNADRTAFWEALRPGNPRLSRRARAFVDAWLDLLFAHGPRDVIDHQAARQLISERERALKRGLARLHNPSALEAWGGASGADQLAYRWNVVRDIVADIAEPLTEQQPAQPAPPGDPVAQT